MGHTISRSVWVLACAGVLGLAACGGGGGGGGGTASGGGSSGGLVLGQPAAPATPAPATPLPVLATSYENFKGVGLTPQTLPAGMGGVGVIRTFGDFSRNGRLDLFTATLTYWPPTTPQAATSGEFAFWRKQADGSFVKDSTLLPVSVGCVHPRKAIVADFNADGRPDVFVACHGFDAAPFPGEKNRIVLSKADGTYETKDASADVGFFHGASAADLDGDGLPDVMVVNPLDPASAYVLRNLGGGAFQREATARLPASVGGKLYYSIELVDVDGDGKLDVWLGGHDWELASATVVLLNPGNNNFAGVTPTVLPAVAAEGVVLDVTLTGSGASRTLWLARTSGGDGTFYQSRVVQKVGWPGLASSVVLNQRPAQWVPWLIPTTVNGQAVLASEDAGMNLAVPQ